VQRLTSGGFSVSYDYQYGGDSWAIARRLCGPDFMGRVARVHILNRDTDWRVLDALAALRDVREIEFAGTET
jgi:hypothetical protein